MSDSGEARTTDHLGRDAKDFAIEFGEYLAQSALRYMVATDAGQDTRDEWRALNSAVYEFRKRAARAKGLQFG